MPAILEVKDLSKSIGDLELFRLISFSIEAGEKTGLIAKNGIGKTTLLSILNGDEDYNSGEVKFLPGVKIGYLPQDPKIKDKSTVLDAVFHASGEVLRLIRDYELALEKNNLPAIEKLTQEIDNLKAWDMEYQVKQLLSQLGINNFYQKVDELSGGQKKRVALAAVLIEEPDFLILDEPTNHLDVEVIAWLEGYLKRKAVSLLMVTHDRYFLDRVCSEILEIDEMQVFRYRGNYSYFLEKRAERIALRQKEIDKAENLLRTEQEWMRRMPKARGTKAKYRIENYYNLKDTASQTIRNDKVKINTGTERLGKKILVADKLIFSWEGVKYLNEFTYTFSPFEKIGILGGNGCGKSTFLDVLTGKLIPESGKLDSGVTVKFGYYRQEGMVFNENMRVIDALSEIAETVSLSDGKVITASQFLNHFLFHPSRQYDYIYKLSGGEKRRLYMCTVLMQNPNFLVLDEPTNDLDIATLEVLEEYLQDFPGSVLVVSHDRYFLDEVVDHIFVFEDIGRIKDYPGNYSQYLEWKQQQQKSEIKTDKLQHNKTEKQEKKSKPVNKLSYNEKREYDVLELEISQLEAEKKGLETKLNSPKTSPEDLIKASERIGELLSLIETKSERWFELAEKQGL
ncbi:MAG: ABC-F family ATP-binding cassette domain-containing protein [Bacteroidales bacterium]|nr:ABC-F family ATP-binding cassette domain-containing protein [Bacteroidales bacterium]MBN2818260.1 ABC-F family ATP-binding cassette domain-containing protein [Bacteroidales bacterium]